MILDTSFIIDVMRGDSSAVILSKEIEQKPLSVTTLTVFELYQGAKNNEITLIQEILTQFTILNFNSAAARRAGLIQKELKKNGRMIDPEDCMIAGIALEHNKKVVTKNKKHFARIPELGIISY